MIAQILSGTVLTTTGILTAALGALFMISALGILHRHLVGIACICAGIALIAWGARFFKGARENTVHGIRRHLLELAENQNGIVKASQIAVQLGKSDNVTHVINTLLQEGAALKRKSGNTILFVFPVFLQRRTCQSCGKDYILLTPDSKCPACSPEKGHKKKNAVTA
ncbi:MAG TPA: hypothetical protein PK544_05910 [Spirochaetota bacterium]|nr:hypothetical protein [Spirochaetota bacterium]HPQ53085.1 hypothetical protein [Spirochaetota bacterium]